MICQAIRSGGSVQPEGPRAHPIRQAIASGNDFFGAAKADGRVSGFEWFVSGNGDRLFLLAHGESDTVGRISEDRDLIAIKTMIQLSHSDFHMSLCASGETVDTMLAVQEAAKAAAH
jgi:hypothetical protein